jgi:hypothetical protein
MFVLLLWINFWGRDLPWYSASKIIQCFDLATSILVLCLKTLVAVIVHDDHHDVSAVVFIVYLVNYFN